MNCVRLDTHVHELFCCLLQAMESHSIHEAARNGDIAALQEELSKGVDIDLRGVVDRTALIHAADNGKRDAVQFLVEQKATVDKSDNSGLTALHHACCHGHAEIAAILLDHGADIDFCDCRGSTPLMSAIKSRKCLKLLLERKADTTVENYSCESALFEAMQSQIDFAVRVLRARDKLAEVSKPTDVHSYLVDWRDNDGCHWPAVASKRENSAPEHLSICAIRPPSDRIAWARSGDADDKRAPTDLVMSEWISHSQVRLDKHKADASESPPLAPAGKFTRSVSAGAALCVDAHLNSLATVVSRSFASSGWTRGSMSSSSIVLMIHPLRSIHAHRCWNTALPTWTPRSSR